MSSHRPGGGQARRPRGSSKSRSANNPSANNNTVRQEKVEQQQPVAEKVEQSSVHLSTETLRCESPDGLVTAKDRWDDLKMYLECNMHKLFFKRKPGSAVSSRSKAHGNFLEHSLSLFLGFSLCMFVTFLIWFGLFMREKVDAKFLEDELKRLGGAEGARRRFLQRE